MANKLSKGILNLTKSGKLVNANHPSIFKNKNGDICMYIDVWINSEPDSYGNNVSIQAQTKKEEEKQYIANAKEYKPKSASNANAKQTHSEGIANDSFLEQTGIPF